MAKEIGEEYASSLSDLTVNSKPLINMLTILAEENIVHAGVIVETVEKHLEKVPSDIKLPVLYLVDSIIKNVGGAYTQKFAQSIVSMFTKTFKVVDEKTRSQMFKLRDTWHDVFPSTKLYQLDVKVNLIDPAWPIQAQPQQAKIHFNPHFLKKPATPVPTPAPAPVTKVLTDEEEKMRLVLAQKEQELMMLQQKKVEMELELKRQLHMAEKTVGKPGFPATTQPAPLATASTLDSAGPARQRLGPPKATAAGRIAPVSGAMLSAVRDPRLAARMQQSAPQQPIAPNVFDIKPLERSAKVVKRKNVLTIDVTAENIPSRPENGSRDPRARREPRLARNKNFEKRPELKERFRARQDKRKAEENRKKDLEKNNRQYEEVDKHIKPNLFLKEDEVIEDFQSKAPRSPMEELLPYFPTVDRKKINKLPPIPKLNRQDDSKTNHVNKTEESAPSPSKRKKESVPRPEKKSNKKRDSGKEGSDSSSSPDKKNKGKDKTNRYKNKETELFNKMEEDSTVPFKELKNYHKERYMRRNKEKSESPDLGAEILEATDTERAEDTNIPDIVVENMDVDLRRLPPPDPAAPIVQKRPSTESLENKTSKKHKLDKLFGSEDVDLRQLPQVEETPKPPEAVEDVEMTIAQEASPKQKDWAEFKEKNTFSSAKDNPEFAVVRAKLAEATKGKDRLGRKPRFSSSMEDTDFRINNKPENLDTENDKETIKMIMSQAEENFKSGSMGKEQYNTLMFQIMQIHEKLKLKEAKQRESLEESKRKLHNVKPNDDGVEPSIKNDNNFGDIDERITPIAYIPRDISDMPIKELHIGDSDLRVKNHMRPIPDVLPRPPLPPMIPAPPFPQSKWRGSRMRTDDFNATRPRLRGPMPPFHRGGHFKDRGPLLPIPLPPPAVGMYQGDCPLSPYTRVTSPPPLGTPGIHILPADYKVIEYIDQDPMKTIEIDGVSREIRFYGRTAIVMLDWETPREIKFFPGTRRITFDNKDSLVLVFNEDYTKAEVDDQVFDIRFGAPTRELYVNDKWYECYFGGPPTGIMIEGVPRVIQLEGPPPQVDIGTEKRTDLVAGKINMIIDATHMFPVFLDAKPQKFTLHNVMHTIRFVDALTTVLINEIPFKIEFGGLPKPIFFGGTKHFIRFSVLPRWVKPGQVKIENMEGRVELPPPITETIVNEPISKLIVDPAEKEDEVKKDERSENGENDENDEKVEKVKEESTLMEVDKKEHLNDRALLNPELENSNPGLDILASVMPTSMAPLSQFSRYSLGSSGSNNQIPGLEAPPEENPPAINTGLPFLGSINVNDLFAKLLATGIVPRAKEESVMEVESDVKPTVKEDVKVIKEDRNTIKVVNLLKSETLRVKQPGIVARLYGGMQCCSCGARFPPEHTVRYSQHLDWHFRQNRRERDSARRAHSRKWHYDLPDWVQYEEVEDLDDREKSWFETNPTEGATEAPLEATEGEAPSVPAGAPQQQFCALCGDKFDQFYNEDKEEWHLRKAVCHEEKNYHPLCFEDFKVSQTKADMKPEQEVEDIELSLNLTDDDPSVILIDSSETPIEIRDDTRSQSDAESVVEVLDEEKEEAVEIEEEDEGDEDDVVLKAEPVEQLEVDDADTDDETQELRTGRDQQAALDFANIKIKQEPIDPDDEPVITSEEQAIITNPDNTSHIVTSSIDGNVQLTTRATTELQTIRINISTQRPPVTTVAPVLEPIMDDDEPLPPGEEIELEYSKKPTLEGVEFIKKPPVQKGLELSGLCSIM